MAIKDGRRVTLYSRNLKDATRQYPAIARAVAALPVTTAMFDGELVAVDQHGRPSFQALHHPNSFSAWREREVKRGIPAIIDHVERTEPD